MAIVFISCGQRTASEVELGNQLCEIVISCGYEPFFAQRRTDLRTLSEVIFDTLTRSSAHIAVLHRRERLGETASYRGSLFIEQELAVAAYIRRTRELPVLFYVQNGVELGGVRSNLLLNSSFQDRREFEDDADVIYDVRRALPSIAVAEVVLPGPNVRLEVRPTWRREGELMMMRISLLVRNRGTNLPNRAMLRAFVPEEFDFAANQPGRAGCERGFNVIQSTIENATIDPDPDRATLVRVFQVPMIRGFSDKVFTFRLAADGQPPQVLSFTYQDLWKAADAETVFTA